MEKPGIIIVEDDCIICLDLQDTLEKMGYEILSVISSGEQAVAQILKLKPDLVIMDVMLRGNVDGIEVARRIHETEDIPVLFVSANSDEATIQRASGCANKIGYLVKPYENAQLRSSIEALLL